MNRWHRRLAQAATMPIRAYQILISPLLPASCRYHPSCSQYAVEALRRFGVFRGAVLALWRIMRCNPWSRGGYDPVEAQKLFSCTREDRQVKAV